MKKYIILLAIVALGVASYGQKQRTISITVDTVKGNENIYLTTGEITGTYDIFTIQTLFTKISTAAGGTAYVEGSIDGTTFVPLTSTTGLVYFYPNDTVSITEGGMMTMIAEKNPFKYYRFLIDGDANDTVIVTPKYVYK